MKLSESRGRRDPDPTPPGPKGVCWGTGPNSSPEGSTPGTACACLQGASVLATAAVTCGPQVAACTLVRDAEHVRARSPHRWVHVYIRGVLHLLPWGRARSRHGRNCADGLPASPPGLCSAWASPLGSGIGDRKAAFGITPPLGGCCLSPDRHLTPLSLTF